jgi:hypothetical protein
MKLKKLSFPLVIALVISATACSSGSSSKEEKIPGKQEVSTAEKTPGGVWPSSYLKVDQDATSGEVGTAKPRTKNAAGDAKKPNPNANKKSNQKKDNGVLTPHTPKDNSVSKTNTTVGVTVSNWSPRRCDAFRFLQVAWVRMFRSQLHAVLFRKSNQVQSGG